MGEPSNEKTGAPRGQVGIVAKYFSVLFLDVVAKLLPGLLVVLALVAALAWPIYALARASTEALIWGAPGVDGFGPAWKFAGPLAEWPVALAVLIIVAAYLVGHILDQAGTWQDIERPSAKRELKRRKRRDKKHHTGTLHQDAWVGRTIQECEFPYTRLASYYRKRGLNHLAKMVCWGEDKCLMCRSRWVTRIIKIRLSYYVPGCAMMLYRMEALLGLSRNIRRALKVILVGSAIGLLLSIVAFFLSWGTSPYGLMCPKKFVGPATAALSAIAIAPVLMWWVTRGFHKERVKEIGFILETAHVASQDHPGIFTDICGSSESNQEASPLSSPDDLDSKGQPPSHSSPGDMPSPTID